jgi:methionyl-tRNA formyltransferase
MRIIFAGSGDFGVPTLAALVVKHQVTGVFTQPDRPTGRGLKSQPTPIGQFALKQSLPLVRTADLNTQTLPPADLLVVIAFGQKIAPQIAGHAPLGSINLHASRLPKLRGAAPINWAILNGDTSTGNSVIRLAPRMDAGAILAQSNLLIGPTETAGELHDRLAQDGVKLILRAIDDLAAARAVESPQDDAQATAAPKLSRQNARIDWSMPNGNIARQIRGLYPWPGCHCAILDAQGAQKDVVTLVRAIPAQGEGHRWRPGEIALDGAVTAGEGAVEVLEIHPRGKRPMPLPDYRRGHAWLPGMRLEAKV